jgi:hypothetical protein
MRRNAFAIAATALAAAFAAGAAPAANRAAPVCTTAGLVIWLNTQGDGAAGSIYYHLEFTNLGRGACSLNGYPGVSAVDLAGRALGSPARRNPALVRSITLASGGTANAVLRIVAVGNYPPSRCNPTSGAGLRVYPPGQRTSKVVPYPLRACAKPGVAYLSIGTLTSGP